MFEWMDLTGYISSSVDERKDWYAGDQHELLTCAIDWAFSLAAYLHNGRYSGDDCWIWYGFLQGRFVWFVLQSGFGSCSGCDYLEANGARAYLESLLSQVRVFSSLQDLERYFQAEDLPPEYVHVRDWVLACIEQFKRSDYY